jgi:hypothetical protein
MASGAAKNTGIRNIAFIKPLIGTNPILVLNVKTAHILFITFFILTAPLLPASHATAQGRKAFGYQNLQSHDAKPYHFGFSLGVNQMNFALKPVEEQFPNIRNVFPEPDLGFHIGIVSNLKLNEYLDLRFVPTLAFGDRYVEFYTGGYGPDNWEYLQHLEATIMEFPVHIKYKSARMINTRAYVIGGFKYTHDLASLDELEGDIFLAVARNDIHYEMGVGFDYYFYYFKFALEVKASFGIWDLKRRVAGGDAFYDPIDRLNSKTVMVSLLFE